ALEVSELADAKTTLPEPSSSGKSAAKPTGFRPKFKAATKKSETENNAEIKSESPEKNAGTTAAPAGFKPRFKPGVTKSKPSSTDDVEEDASHSERSAADQAAPVNHPRGFTP